MTELLQHTPARGIGFELDDAARTELNHELARKFVVNAQLALQERRTRAAPRSHGLGCLGNERLVQPRAKQALRQHLEGGAP